MSASTTTHCPTCAAPIREEEDPGAQLARGDIGVLYSKRGILLGFVRIRV